MKNQIFGAFLVAILLPLVYSSAAWAATLRRVDMIVAGSSCASCLIRIEKKLKTTPGVLKAMVSVYRPYSAVVIYDSAKTSMAEISKVLSSEKARPDQAVDVSIKAVPALLLPAAK